MTGLAAGADSADGADRGHALNCMRCGYSLRGLGEGAACPECGLPASASREGTPLLHAPAPWLRHLGLACAVEAASIVALFAYDLLLRFHLLPPEPAAAGAGGDRPFPLITALGIGTALFSLIGAWMLTRPQPNARESVVSRRRLVRVAAGVLVVLRLDARFHFLSGPLSTDTDVRTSLLFSVWAAADLLFPLMRALYLRQLAYRLARPGLALQISFAVVGWAVCLGAGRVLPHLFYAVWVMRGRPHGFWYFYPSPAAEYGWWAFAMYEAVVLLLFRRAFREAAGPIARTAGQAGPAAGDEDEGVL